MLLVRDYDKCTFQPHLWRKPHSLHHRIITVIAVAINSELDVFTALVENAALAATLCPRTRKQYRASPAESLKTTVAIGCTMGLVSIPASYETPHPHSNGILSLQR